MASDLIGSLAGAFGVGAADQETLGLIEQIIVNETTGHPGNPFASHGGGGGGGGFDLSILNPYLRLYIYQQENPWFFPVVGASVGMLVVLGLASLIGD
jgi:hypothetical protein